MKNVSGGCAAAKGLNEYARKAVYTFYKSAGSIAKTLSSPLNYIDSAIGNSRKNLSYETKVELIKNESGFGIKGSGAMEADILKYFIAKEKDVKERFKRNGGSEKRLDEILSGIESGYENSLRKMHKQMPSAVQEFLNSGEPSAGNPLGAVYIPDTLFEEYQNIPRIPDSFLVPEPDAKFGGILKASEIAGNERKLGGAKPNDSLPDRFSVPDEHKKFGGVKRIQYRASGSGLGGKPIDGIAKTEEIGTIESHFYDGLYKVYDVFVDRPVGELLGGIEKLAKYASDKFMEHPYFYTAAVAVGLGGVVADAAFNNSKITKSAADYAKNPSKIVVSASGFIGGLGELMKGNQPPVADTKIDTSSDKWVAGEKIVFNASGSSGTEYTWLVQKNGQKGMERESTKTPFFVQRFTEGNYKITPIVTDDKGWQKVGKPVEISIGAAPSHAMETTTEEPSLMYDGIKIIGDEQFQKDNLMWMEFAKKYSPADYEFIKSNIKWINSSDYFERAGGGGGYISWNKKYLRELIENKELLITVGAAAHESGHNFFDKNDPKNNTENNAGSFGAKAGMNLSYVNQSEIDKFYQEFNFSQFKK